MIFTRDWLITAIVLFLIACLSVGVVAFIDTGNSWWLWLVLIPTVVFMAG